MDTDLNNFTGHKKAPNDNAAKHSENSQRDANANVHDIITQRGLTAIPDTQPVTSIQQIPTTGVAVPSSSLPTSQSPHDIALLIRERSAANRTNNLNRQSFANIANNPMSMSFPSLSSQDSSSSSSSLSSVPAYYLKSDSHALLANTLSTSSSDSMHNDEQMDMSLSTDAGFRCEKGNNGAVGGSEISKGLSPDVEQPKSAGADSSKKNELTRPVSQLVPSSPPTTRHSVTTDQEGVEPVAPSRLARIRQSHLASKRREQIKKRTMKLPEVNENSELELPDHPSTAPADLAGFRYKDSNSFVMPQISLSAPGDDDEIITETKEDGEVAADEDGGSESSVTPNLPDSFLKRLGLLNRGVTHDGASSSNLDQLSEQEIENKFVSLSLAFRTDKLSIDQRVSVQERARDLAEQNVDKELQGLGESVEMLSQTVQDCEVIEIVQKIRRHISILEQSAARVSSRAEVYGAVQQERRMCKAIEVMVQYTENLKRVREKEESELQEARKIINERSIGGGLPDFESGFSRRSMSVCGPNAMGRTLRRRSEVVLPKVLGGIGSPSLIQTASMDPRSRFQSVVASTSMKNAITNTMKRASLERLNSSSPSSSPRTSTITSPLPSLLNTSSSSLDGSKDAGGRSRGHDRISESSTESKDGALPSEEDAYKKGFEEGLKTRLSQDLSELRDQQASISNSLEDVMDRVDLAHEQDQTLLERPSRLRAAITAIQALFVFLVEYDYLSNKKLIRNIAGVVFVLMAIMAVFLSPPSSSVNIQQVSKPPQ